MPDLTTFTNPAFGEIRTLTIDSEPWFVAADICACLEVGNSRQALTRLDDDEKGVISNDTPGGKQDMNIINEPGLYSLVLSSRKSEAKQFKRWITHEVLPAIRKTGRYIHPNAPNQALAEKRANAMALNAKCRVAKQMMELWTAAGVTPEHQALALNGYYEGLEVPREALKGRITALLDKTTIAKHLGVLSKSGAPHAQAVGAVIGYLKLEDGECQKTPYSRNGHDGESEQYTPSVEQKVAGWLAENGWPTKIVSGSKSYSVQYQKE